MKILFIIPSSVGDYFSAQIPHTGIGYLVAVLKTKEIETKIVDMRLGYSIDDVLKMIDDFNPGFVGITLYSFGFDKSKDIVNTVKEHSNNYKVISGGPHVSAVRKKVIL